MWQLMLAWTFDVWSGSCIGPVVNVCEVLYQDMPSTTLFSVDSYTYLGLPVKRFKCVRCLTAEWFLRLLQIFYILMLTVISRFWCWFYSFLPNSVGCKCRTPLKNSLSLMKTWADCFDDASESVERYIMKSQHFRRLWVWRCSRDHMWYSCESEREAAIMVSTAFHCASVWPLGRQLKSQRRVLSVRRVRHVSG